MFISICMPITAAPRPRSTRKRKPPPTTTSRCQIATVPSVCNCISPWPGGLTIRLEILIEYSRLLNSAVIFFPFIPLSCLCLSLFYPMYLSFLSLVGGGGGVHPLSIEPMCKSDAFCLFLCWPSCNGYPWLDNVTTSTSYWKLENCIVEKKNNQNLVINDPL